MDGTPSATKSYELVEHGITTESAKWRCHVCFLARMIYLFKTEKVIQAIQRNSYPERPATQNGMHGKFTAIGYLVPYDDIPGIVAKEIPPQVLSDHQISKNQGESDKGRAAEEIWKSMAYAFHDGNLVPIRKASVPEDKHGTDCYVAGERIQVKCDFAGGDKLRGGTGNLYIQRYESNPFGKF